MATKEKEMPAKKKVVKKDIAKEIRKKVDNKVKAEVGQFGQPVGKSFGQPVQETNV